MLKSMRSRSSNILVYALIGMLILGLAGFGITDVLSGRARSDIATVGDRTVTQQEYSRALVQALNNASQQFGQQLTLEQARLFGLDATTLRQLINSHALANEAAERGVAANDEMLRASIVSTPAFRNTNGQFDSEAYNFALSNANYTVREYEALIRSELSRNLLNPAITGGLDADTTAATALGQFLYAEHAVNWARIDLDTVAQPDAPSEAELAEWHGANEADYTLPESRSLTVAALDAETLMAAAGITDEQVAAEYQARLAQFETAERRGIDRIVFADEAAAADARARLDAEEITFNDLLDERGLTVELASMGLVEATSLNAEARFGVFSIQEPGIVGPLPSDLGPALFRVNAIIAATTTPLEAVADDLRAALAEPFIRQSSAEAYGEAVELIAGGASLEELAAETNFVLSTLDYTAAGAEGLSADPAFASEAAAAREGERRNLIEASNGTLFVLRVDSITPPSVQPLADVRDEVEAAWMQDAHLNALKDRADSLVRQIESGADFLAMMDALSLAVVNTPGVTRAAPAGALPDVAARAVFDLPEGGVTAVADGTGYILLQLAEISAASPESYAEFVTNRQTADSARLTEDVFAYFTNAVRDDAGVEINQPLIDAVLDSIR